MRTVKREIFNRNNRITQSSEQNASEAHDAADNSGAEDASVKRRVLRSKTSLSKTEYAVYAVYSIPFNFNTSANFWSWCITCLDVWKNYYPLYERDDKSKVDSHKFRTFIEEVDSLHQLVQKPREQVADAEALFDITNTLVTSVKAYNNDGLTPSDCVSCLLRDFGKEGGPSSNRNEQSGPIRWEDIGEVVSVVFSSAPRCRTMIGHMNTELKEHGRAEISVDGTGQHLPQRMLLVLASLLIVILYSDMTLRTGRQCWILLLPGKNSCPIDSRQMKLDEQTVVEDSPETDTNTATERAAAIRRGKRKIR
ncbi:hypothetical protein SASPL_111272 [Salvia splendens]|uniref:Non-structural maintenance of chromosomes element 4 n=1 Tax=Salvia splendens TaxID=180675 RepID=A0A8X9A3G9_SALSN|nr:hypothetical protein SASPL_111272 [Salvia splendens]